MFDAWPAELVHAEYVVVKVITTNLAFVFKEGFRKLLQLRLSLEINRTKKNMVFGTTENQCLFIFAFIMCIHLKLSDQIPTKFRDFIQK